MTRAASPLDLAIADVAAGFKAVHVWSALGWQDVVQRYRRSLLGPLWLTISTGIMVVIMGPLYGKLFGQDISAYFGFLAIGFVVWQLVAQSINDCCVAFITAESFIKQVKLPLSVYILRVVWKNIIIFFHNMVVVVAVLAWLRPSIGPSLLSFPIALLVFALNAYFFGAILGIICARFRDIPLIIANVVQAAFFLTPVLWLPDMLGRHRWTVDLNPFYHFIEIIRAPMLGAAINPRSWPIVLGITLIGACGMLWILKRFRARVAYWV
jgi:ABC-2 type transport system permease protein